MFIKCHKTKNRKHEQEKRIKMSWDNTPNKISPWDNFEEVDPKQARNNYIPAGVQGIVKVVELKVIYSKKNNNRPIFVASLAVEDCGEDHEKGLVWDWVAKADEKPYQMNIKSLVCAINPDSDPRSFGREVMDTLTGADNPAKGATLRIRTESIKTSRGNDFTKVHFFAVDAD